MKKKFKTATLLFLLVFLGVCALADEGGLMLTELPSVESILSRYVDAVGGREAIEKLTSRVCTGKEVTDLTSRQQPIYESHYFKAWAKIPMSFYTEEWTDGGTQSRGYDGQVAWTKDICGVAPDKSGGKRRLDWLLNPQNALRIKDYFPNLALEGTQDVRGHSVYVLKSPELHRPLFFDTETGLLIGFGHNWEIHDYVEVDGVLFPHRVHLSRKGGSTVYEFERVEHNVEIDDSLFVMPR